MEFTLSPESQRVMTVIRKMPFTAKRGMTTGWIELGQGLKRDANREILRRPKSGRLYRVRRGRAGQGRRVRHRASAPGETHANITGRVRRSLSWKVSGFDELTFGYGVASNKHGLPPDYAKLLEFSTKRMAARSSLQNAINGNIRNAQTYFGRSIPRAIHKKR